MATDQKLISSLLDLSRNVDKLSSDIKRNTASTEELVGVQEKSTEGNKDLGKIAESIKGLDLKSLKGEFSQLTKSISGLDFKGLSSDLKSLDFKSLSKDLKSLDFKELTQGIKGLDLKSLSGITKGLDLKNVTDSFKSGGVKDIVSGSLGGLLKKGKGILGAFEEGGSVNQTGNYIVGEKGPEVVKLDKGSSVISNDILRERQEILKKLGKNAPNDKEISSKRTEIFSSDPTYYKEEASDLERDLNSYLESLDKNSTFTREDIQKLGKSSKSKAENIISPEAVTAKIDKASNAKEAKIKENREGLFSRVFGKKSDKSKTLEDNSGFASDIVSKGKDLLKNVNKDSIFSKGSELLKKSSGLLGEKNAGKLNMVGDVLSKASFLGKKSKEASITTKPQELKVPELKTSIKKLSPQPQPKVTTKTPVESQDSKKETVAPTKTEDISQNKPASENTSENKKPQAEGTEGGITSNDIQEMKAALVRIASLLEGPLNVSSMDRPFRPDSRRV